MSQEEAFNNLYEFKTQRKDLFPDTPQQSSQPVAQESVLDQFKMKSSTEFGVAE